MSASARPTRASSATTAVHRRQVGDPLDEPAADDDVDRAILEGHVLGRGDAPVAPVER